MGRGVAERRFFSLILPMKGGPLTLSAQIGTDGTTSNGTGGYGVGFSIPIDQTVTVTVGSPAVLMQDVLC